MFEACYSEVRRGRGAELDYGSDELRGRALLLVWPNNPDADDNRHLLPPEDDAPPSWDVGCLERFVASGGETVLYVGEREEALALRAGAQAESGMCASRRFQRMLRERFRLVEVVAIPTWWLACDDFTVWQRRRVPDESG